MNKIIQQQKNRNHKNHEKTQRGSKQELNNTMTELRNSVESFNNIFGQAEERVSEVEYRLFEIIQLEEQKEKKK